MVLLKVGANTEALQGWDPRLATQVLSGLAKAHGWSCTHLVDVHLMVI